ncbi:MAG: S-adenosylmethionine:tRNA ribosyltransferase-isomerase, partial [Candidatus Fimimonas sp.]
MKTSDFYYDLPQELIAQTPVEPRDSSRLLVYNRSAKTVEHRHFYDVTNYLQKGDVLVVNNTKVLPARIYGKKEGTGGKVEFLLLKRLDLTHWEVILKPGRIAKPGAVFVFSDKLKAKVESIGEDGSRIVEFAFDGVFEDVLSQVGEMPLPPYIHEKLGDKTRYNTVYSKVDGSAAAPTAGLHFTKELLQKVKDMGVEVVEV